MNRREFNASLVAATAAGIFATQQATAQTSAQISQRERPIYNMVIYPNMVLQDLVGPMTAFNLTMGEIRLIWKDRTPVATDVGIPITATHTFADCPRNGNVLFVPGGLAGTTQMMEDSDMLSFLREIAGKVDYTTSVCTGGLILGAAGLLKARRATTHWYVHDILPLLGAIPIEARVVEDGNLITGGASQRV
ncbi:DJ-1/PfpI family protein [Roseobacter sp. GAI101]|uniref:DJ-1/PfpI family protein n=1 Tax=Roseobacter sp. (strain GAI101) TaxID=391589 RepID=UPI00018723CC|nr:DJ-1/PfpI family protein [Roseobacter sp. GAI101]EEB82406.1 ThiJ family protein [Roseobacter sp. GAI101]